MVFKGIFFGTPEIGARALEATLKLSDIQIVGIVTQTDKPVGPKQILTPSPVKEIALKNSLPVFQPKKITDEFIQGLGKLEPDFILLVAYGKMLPSSILKLPKIAPLNIHPSMLPKLRGASPIQYAILEGYEETGVSLMIMNEGMDTGDIVTQRGSIVINNEDTTDSLTKKIIPTIEEIINKDLIPFLRGEIIAKPQDNNNATSTKLIKKEVARLNWSKSATDLAREIRAFQPWPISWFEWQNQRIQVLKADVTNTFSDTPGKTTRSNQGLLVQTENGALDLITIKPAGKSPMPALSFLNGHPKILETEL